MTAIPPRVQQVIDGVSAILTVAAVEYERFDKRRKERMAKDELSDDEIEQAAGALPKNTAIRCGMDDNRATIAAYDGKHKIVQFSMGKTETGDMIAQLQKIFAILPDETPAASP